MPGALTSSFDMNAICRDSTCRAVITFACGNAKHVSHCLARTLCFGEIRREASRTAAGSAF